MKMPLLFVLFCMALLGHPMGNFSVSHYAKLEVTPRGLDLEYALDLAEIPTFELLRTWHLDQTSPRTELDRRAAEQAREWLTHLFIAVDGTPAPAQLQSATLVIADGAGGLPILRITALAHVDAKGGKLTYEDDNFPDRAGWKEILIDHGPGATLQHASQSNRDVSKALTAYPPDPTLAPPQDLRAELVWTEELVTERPVVATGSVREKQIQPRPGKIIIEHISQPASPVPAVSPATLTSRAAPLGTVARGDFLSKLLAKRDLTPWMMLVALLSAFALGCAHALTPGHGKTIVAAYLVGSRGTLRHAAFLGAMVTFTHTVAVFALGIVTLFLFRYIVPEKMTQILGATSGLSIVAVGAWMLRKRIWNSAHHSSPHSHTHPHSHPHSHNNHPAPHHTHDSSHRHDHEHQHDHHHGHSHTHSHVPDDISWRGLMVLGASGGLVPCESALVLLLGAIAIGRIGLGLVLLVAFSFGLALVLTAIGVLVLFAKNLVPERRRVPTHPLIRWISITSPAIVMIVGAVMTCVSLGWFQAKWTIG